MGMFCGEIQYKNVHSDICDHDLKEMTPDYRQFLHDCLNEWLDKSEGDGIFWVGDPAYWDSFVEKGW